MDEKQKNLSAQEVSDNQLDKISGGAYHDVIHTDKLTLNEEEVKFLKQQGINNPYAIERRQEVIDILQDNGFNVDQNVTIGV